MSATKNGQPITDAEQSKRERLFIDAVMNGFIMSHKMLGLMQDAFPEKTYTGKDVQELLTAILNDAADTVIDKYGALDEPAPKG